MDKSPLEIYYEATPNPQSMKFVLTGTIADENVQFDSLQAAERSPLASKIFGFPWTAAVFIGANFVTVTKQDWVDWEVLADPLSNLILEHLNDGLPVLLPQANIEMDESNDSPIVKQIKLVLNNEIRPAVAMDGGDVVFHKYEDGRVYLHMQGACAGCPSSSFTLKQGIEVRLREAIPEITEVIAL